MFEGAAVLQVSEVSEGAVMPAGADPMIIRWGVSCGVRNKFVEGERTGFSEIPFGKFFPITQFSTPEEIHTVDESLPREQRVTKTALSVQLYLSEMLGGTTHRGDPDPNKADWGIRFGFHGETDHAKMAVISATLLPSLPEIRNLATTYGLPNPIGAQCGGQEEIDFEERTDCLTCWLSWVNSSVCDQYLIQTSESGRQVEVLDIMSGTRTLKVVTPTLDELGAARLLVTESLRQGVTASQNLWLTIATEIKEGERKRADTYQNNIRKDVHGTAPADQQLAQVREYARVVGGNSGGGDNSGTLERIVGVLDRIDQRLTAVETPQPKVPVEATAPAVVTPPIEPTLPPTATEVALAPAAARMEEKKNGGKK